MDLGTFERRVVRLSLAVALLLAASHAVAERNTEDVSVLRRIDSLVRGEADARLLSGVILVARGDRILFQRGYGFANWELQVPNDRSTRFGIASITKIMTEIVARTLASEGRLDLDAPVARYLGSFPTGPDGGVVTVRHLLTHRSGVPHRVTTDLEETLPISVSDIVNRVRARGLLFEPGTRELYSSAGFTCLARVIEVIERKPFDSILLDRVFRPASMAAATGETGQQLMQHRALPYRLSAAGHSVVVASARYKNLSFLIGAGSLYATAEDLWHFVRALRTGVFGETGTTRMTDSGDETWQRMYGRTNGYEASVDYLPAQDLTFVFLSNLQSAANWQVRRQVVNLLTAQKATPIRRPPAVGAMSETPDSFLGSYGDPTDPIVIAESDGHLFRDDNEFYPVEGGYYIPASGSTMRFRRASDGRTNELITVWPDGRERVLARVEPRPHVTP